MKNVVRCTIVAALMIGGVGAAMSQTKGPASTVAPLKTAAQTRSEMRPLEGVPAKITVLGFLPRSRYECSSGGLIQFGPREIIVASGNRTYGLLLSIGTKATPFRYTNVLVEEIQIEELGKLLHYLSSFKPDVTKA